MRIVNFAKRRLKLLHFKQKLLGSRGTLGPYTVLKELVKGHIVRVPIEQCVNSLGFSYFTTGWHYYTALLKEIDKSENEIGEKSVLHTFYELYRPGSFANFMVPPDYPISKKMIGFESPWFERKNNHDYRLDEVHQCGPRSEKAIQEDIDRIRSLYEKIKVEGYKPLRYPDGFIRGVFIIRRTGEWRFLVTAGQHRCAILSHLGVHSAWMRLQPDFPHYVRQSQSACWPLVQSGEWSDADAQKYFDLLFKLNGRERAIEMGLLEVDFAT